MQNGLFETLEKAVFYSGLPWQGSRRIISNKKKGGGEGQGVIRQLLKLMIT